jgi:hypothetical protein
MILILTTEGSYLQAFVQAMNPVAWTAPLKIGRKKSFTLRLGPGKNILR